MAAADPLQDILSAEIDESAVSALVGSLESRLASPSHKDLSNSLADTSVNNNHLPSVNTAVACNSPLNTTQTTIVTTGSKGLSGHNVHGVNSLDNPNVKLNHSDSQIIGINSIINSNSPHLCDANRGSPVVHSNGVLTNVSQGNLASRASPHLQNNLSTSTVAFTNSIPGGLPQQIDLNSQAHTNLNTSFAITKGLEGSSVVSLPTQVLVKQENISASSVGSSPLTSQTHFVIKSEPCHNSPISNLKQDPSSAGQTMHNVSQHKVSIHQGSLNQVTHGSNVQILNPMGQSKGQTVVAGNPSVIAVRTPGSVQQGQVVMRPQIITTNSVGPPMHVVNVSNTGHVQRLAQGKAIPRVALATPARHPQIAPRPGATGAITLPPGAMISPQGTFVKNEQGGQLMFVTVNQAGQIQTAPGGVGQRIQYVKPPNSSQPQPRVPTTQIVSLAPGAQIGHQTVLRQTVPVSSVSAPPGSTLTVVRTQAPGALPQTSKGAGQSPLDNVKKCKNFLSTLLKLAASQPQETVTNVRDLIQGLIDGVVEPETFTERLQTELRSSPQPYLVPFLKKSLPSLREAIAQQKMTIEGVKAPPASVLQQHHQHLRPGEPVQATIHLPNRIPAQVVRQKGPAQVHLQPRKVPPGVQPTQAMHKGVVTLSGKPGAPALVPVGSVPSPQVKKEKTKFETLNRDDDDINDVATMGGVNLTEESKNMASNADYVGTQIRSCKDETFLHHHALINRIQQAAKKHGLDDVSSEVVNIISHATQERLRDLVEKLATIAEHRMEIYKVNEKFEASSDVRSQLKFLEELDKMEKKRHEDQEWEKIMKAAKSRSKHEDPEQQKIKQKAKELQQAETERLRQEEANQTALAAIGPRKKRKTEAADTGQSAGALNIPNGPGSSSSRSSLRPRIKRVTLKDILFLMEQDPSLARSDLLYRTLLK